MGRLAAEIGALQNEEPPTSLAVPGLWNDLTLAADGAETMGSFGCGTYRLRVLLPEDAAQLAVRMQDAATAYRLYINDRLEAANFAHSKGWKSVTPRSSSRNANAPSGPTYF